MSTKGQNLIVLDMDGVLVDVSASYREAVRMTARLFFKDAPGWAQLPNPLFSLEEIAAVKQTGGLNNDWELTYRILDLLMLRVRGADDIPSGDSWIIYRQVLKDTNISPLIHFLQSHDTPLQNLLCEHNGQTNRLVQQLSANDVGDGNIVKQIFQELYLGKDLFSKTYNLPPLFHKSEGLINLEKLLVDPNALQELATKNLMAIATGRPKAEAYYPLQKFKISPYFGSVLTLDDCLNAERVARKKNGRLVSLSKPHPYMLDTIAESYINSISKCFYIGDMPDDMLAARHSKYKYSGIGFTATAPNKNSLSRALKEAGASHIINDFDALAPILSQSS